MRIHKTPTRTAIAVLTPDQIKPYLLHDDWHIRIAAVEYCSDSWSRDPDLIPLMLDACERFGEREDKLSLHHAGRFTLTEPSLDRVLDYLTKSEDEATIRSLNAVIAHAPAELLIAREVAIRDNPNLDPEIIPRLDRRRDFSGWSGEKLWQELEQFARAAQDAVTTGDLDLDYSEDLVNALARHQVPDDETLCRLLRDLEPEEGWLEIFLVDLAGERRMTRAVPALVDKFRIDSDYLLERSLRALAKIGDPEASRLIRATYPTGDDDFKYFPPAVLAAIKHPESEDAILAWLETEEDILFRTLLCAGLCELFSERGIEVVRNQIEAEYDKTFTNLEDDLLPVIEVLGIDLPEADQWKKNRTKREQERARRMAEWDALDRRYEELKAKGIDPLARLKYASESTSHREIPALPEPVPPVETFRRTGQKVGRNDPCPCGSGKKFKKCCGRSV
jgi:hypothetical protein